MRVRDQMLDDVTTIPSDRTVQDAARLMEDHATEVLAVGDADHLEGMLTRSDILKRVVAAGRNPAETPVRQVMSPSPHVCRADDSDRVAMRAMRDHAVKQLPVVDGQGHLVGLVTKSAIDVGTLLGAPGA
jgi:CBS domain-containing protein